MVEQQPRLAFHFANIRHESIARMSAAQKDEALHELIDLRDYTKDKIFASDASTQTRIFGLCAIYDRAQKTATRRPDGTRVIDTVTQQVPTWIGDRDQEGSLAYRYGMSAHSITNELEAYEKAGLMKRFYPPSSDGKSHLVVSVAPELLTNSELLPMKGERPRRKNATCKDCGSPELRKKTTTTVACADCGCVQSHSEHECMVNEQEAQEGTKSTVYPSTPPEVEQHQDTLSSRDAEYVIVIEESSRDADNVLTDWLQKRLGYGGQIFATGRPSPSKYLPFYGPFHIESYLDGDRENIYGSQLRQADGKTWVWSADIDERDKEVYSKLDEFIQRLSSAGVPAIAWLRRDGSAHVEITFSETVLPEQADAYILSIVPEFGALKERYPVTTTNKLSWPFYYRIGNKVHPCTARYMSDELHSLQVASDDVTLQQLAILAQECITPAQLVSEYIAAHPIEKSEPEPQRTTRPQPGGVLGKDLVKQVIADFNASHSWLELLGQPNRHGKYAASWRDYFNLTVAVDARTDLAKDFSTDTWLAKAMDKYQVYCFIEGGENWQEFKRLDLAQRCAQLREAQEPDEDEQPQEQEREEIPTTLFADVGKVAPIVDEHGCPTRLTYCCQVPFQLDSSGKPECSNPECPEKQERKAS